MKPPPLVSEEEASGPSLAPLQPGCVARLSLSESDVDGGVDWATAGSAARSGLRVWEGGRGGGVRANTVSAQCEHGVWRRRRGGDRKCMNFDRKEKANIQEKDGGSGGAGLRLERG